LGQHVSVKKLTIIEVLLTVIFLGVFTAGAQVAMWLKSMPESDPLRQLWEPRFRSYGDIPWVLVFVPWAVFTVIYLIVAFVRFGEWAFRKLGNHAAV
jgi:hypothetical protein